MRKEYIECPEMSNKTIETIRFYKVNEEGIEMQINLTDGTVFSCSFCNKPVFEARLLRTQGNAPEVLQSYELD